MKFGVREICDVTFKTTADFQRVGNTVFEKAGMPAFMIDTARTSSLEQASTTVYAQGGKGYNRLIAWEGEKTMTFTVEDALISPMGLAVLSGAGLIDAAKDNLRHVHVTYDVQVGAATDKTVTDVTGATSTIRVAYAEVSLADLKEETGLEDALAFDVCKADIAPAYATVLDGSGAGIQFIPDVKLDDEKNVDSTRYEDAITVDANNNAVFVVDEKYAYKTIKLDFYLFMSTGVTEVEIKPQDFGGYFYVEAQTLFRREDSGKDMAAELILPKVKVQSGFTFTMAASGDPSTFTFTMDAFPGYTMFDKTKKVMCVMQIIGADKAIVDNILKEAGHDHKIIPQVDENGSPLPDADTPVLKK